MLTLNTNRREQSGSALLALAQGHQMQLCLLVKQRRHERTEAGGGKHGFAIDRANTAKGRREENEKGRGQSGNRERAVIVTTQLVRISVKQKSQRTVSLLIVGEEQLFRWHNSKPTCKPHSGSPRHPYAYVTYFQKLKNNCKKTNITPTHG